MDLDAISEIQFFEEPFELFERSTKFFFSEIFLLLPMRLPITICLLAMF